MNDADRRHEQMHQEYCDHLQEIIKRNHDLAERAKGKLRAGYDEEWEMFSVTIGEDLGAESISIDNGFVIRYDPASLKIIAFELYGFHKLLAEHSPFVRLCFGLLQQCGPVQMSLLPEADFSADFKLLPSLQQAS